MLSEACGLSCPPCPGRWSRWHPGWPGDCPCRPTWPPAPGRKAGHANKELQFTWEWQGKNVKRLIGFAHSQILSAWVHSIWIPLETRAPQRVGNIEKVSGGDVRHGPRLLYKCSLAMHHNALQSPPPPASPGLSPFIWWLQNFFFLFLSRLFPCLSRI